MTKRKRVLIICTGVAAVLILAALCISPFIAVSLPDLSETGDCISVVFDKAAVKNADRLVFKKGSDSFTVTDSELVRQIASEFVVANRTGLCGEYRDQWLEIYNGDRLVRSIHWNDHDDLAVVYNEDTLHLVFPGTQGQAQLSQETVDLINEIVS